MPCSSPSVALLKPRKPSLHVRIAQANASCSGGLPSANRWTEARRNEAPVMIWRAKARQPTIETKQREVWEFLGNDGRECADRARRRLRAGKLRYMAQAGRESAAG